MNSLTSNVTNGRTPGPSIRARWVIAFIYFLPVFLGLFSIGLLGYALQGYPTEDVAKAALAASGISALLGNVSFNLARAVPAGEDRVLSSRLIFAGSILAYAAILLAMISAYVHVGVALRGTGPRTNLPDVGGEAGTLGAFRVLGTAVFDFFFVALILAALGLFHLCVALSCRHLGLRDVPLRSILFARQLPACQGGDGQDDQSDQDGKAEAMG